MAVAISETRYAKTPDGIYLAYQTAGDAPIDLVWQFDLIFGNVEDLWDSVVGDFLRELATFSRLILHDRRGIGLSSRNVSPPDLETRVADLSVVLDAARSERPVLGGHGEGAASNVMFAASRPERVHSVVWSEPTGRATWAPDYPWGVGREYVERIATLTAELWGTEAYGPALAEVEATLLGNEFPPEWAATIGRLSRHIATPDVAIAVERIYNETDVRPILPSVSAPALLLSSWPEEAEHVASLLPKAEVRIVPASWAERQAALVANVRKWLGVAPPPPDIDRVLAAVLFTDIVGSTERLVELGDARWRSLLARHHERARIEIERHRGRFIDSAGDGIFATFDGPARAVRCAMGILSGVDDLGIQVRAGVHTGEVELEGDAVRGFAVHVGARVAGIAGPGEVFATSMVKDLVAGSGLVFEDRGEHVLKGIPDRWHIYAVAPD
jgi:class 3 adenylate cyclase/pimeloyl-ACP methyl ester carboxylesterase